MSRHPDLNLYIHEVSRSSDTFYLGRGLPHSPAYSGSRRAPFQVLESARDMFLEVSHEKQQACFVAESDLFAHCSCVPLLSMRACPSVLHRTQ